ncbi:hypothetical protein B842_03280 [Corynebacterium humireducens NBRC 106098 = DSM 45392]|uniref:Minor tail protein n=1 Tax=Corynebacterium humireducens NBRC 106098 = DSM 45392 TaxID=1223515 RepID=A0A0B5D9Y5_9CORY|nr:hypothetical protein [Corynebacterium humireducens]AJE32509.1 hypothetical protein B842_03280 [Corynebacterium humireducens NBRC 106098 = DSM 45392]
MHRGWLQLGQTEIANTARTVAYMRNGVRNTSTQIVTDDSWPMLPYWLGRTTNWVLPEVDEDCPWYDRTDSASAEFAGVWPLRVDGLDSTPLDREVIEGAVAGGGFGVLRTPPREIEIEALVIGATPAGLAYGLGWLGAALRGDTCQDGGRPRNLLFLESAPAFDAQMTPSQVQALGNAQSRMVAQVTQTEGLRVEESFSPWTAEDRGATVARVSFTLTAGVPWVWRTPTRLVSGLQPAAGEPLSLRFENVGPGGVFEQCQQDVGLLVDPAAAPLVSLPRPVSPAATVGMQPLLSRRTQWTLDAGRLPRWAEAVPSVTVTTGPQAERAVRVQWVQGVVASESDITCGSLGEAMIGYIPPNSSLTLDAVTGDATVVTADGLLLDATPVVTGRWGGPWRSPVLRCSQPYTLVIDTLQNVHDQVRVDVDGLVRQP